MLNVSPSLPKPARTVPPTSTTQCLEYALIPLLASHALRNDRFASGCWEAVRPAMQSRSSPPPTDNAIPFPVSTPPKECAFTCKSARSATSRLVRPAPMHSAGAAARSKDPRRFLMPSHPLVSSSSQASHILSYPGFTDIAMTNEHAPSESGHGDPGCSSF